MESSLAQWLDLTEALRSGGWIAFGGALLLGLRHVGDPDHLTAVATLAVSEAGSRRAGWLGLAWGTGHAVTFLALGLAVVAVGRSLPESLRAGLEVAIGGAIAALALRLLVRWRRGVFHSHPHSHGALRHSHPHLHEEPGKADLAAPHRHEHPARRSPLTAFGIGLLHGAGGSAAIGVLLAGAFRDPGHAMAALVLIALATTAAMTVFSAALGGALGSRRLAARLDRVVPVFGVAALAFGVWYAAAPVLQAVSLP
jgi:hypothetical protein